MRTFVTKSILLGPIRYAKAQNAVDETAAPGLWAMWNEFDGATPRARRTLAIDADLNVSIAEHKRYLGLVHRHLTMRVGLPLLIVLDERAVRAVVAHEVAHARLQHTSGAVNLQEFIAAVDNLFDHVDPVSTISGRIAYPLLRSLLEWVTAEYRMMSARTNSPPNEEDNPESAHPPLRARLANLGFATFPQVETAKTSAAASVLSPAAMTELSTAFNERWRRNAKAVVELR
jgi:hypothetical protein